MVVGSLVRLTLTFGALIAVGEALGLPTLTIASETVTWAFDSLIEWLIDRLSPW